MANILFAAGLHQNIQSAAAQGGLGILEVLIAGNHNHRNIGMGGLHPLQQLQTVHQGHPNVRNHQIRTQLFYQLLRFLAVLRFSAYLPAHI
ncbi:hypothetical protein D3C76_1175860 [compost metagenome]